MGRSTGRSRTKHISPEKSGQQRKRQRWNLQKSRGKKRHQDEIPQEGSSYRR